MRAETYDYISNAINELMDAIADETLSDNELGKLKKAFMILEELLED